MMGNKQATPKTQLYGDHRISETLMLHVSPATVSTPKGNVGCYVISSKGLPLHHPEIVISIRCIENLRFNVIVNFFLAIEQAANQGNVVQPGGLTTFGAPVFDIFHGVLYAQAIQIGDIVFPDSYLMGYFVTKEELKIVNGFGGMRLLSLFAQSYLYFPYPPFNDFNRPQMGSLDWSKSMLCHVGGRAFSHCYFTKHDQQNVLLMEISRSHITELKETIDALGDLPVGIRANNIAKGCDSCLFWKPGQQGASANSSGNTALKIAGCFLIFLPNQPENEIMLLEDGFVYKLQDPTWATLKNALITGEDITIRSTQTGSCDLQICWSDAISEKLPPDPVDLDRVEIMEMTELNQHPEMSDTLVKFIKDITDKTKGHIKLGPEPIELRIEIVLDPNGATSFSLLARPSLPEDLGGLDKALKSISSPAVPFVLHINLVFNVAMKH